jgi:hypothetical protein
MATLSDIRRRGTELDVLAFIREVKRQARRKLPKGAKKAHVSAAVTRLLCEGEVQPPPGIWLPPVLAVVAVRRNFGVVYHWSCPVCRQPRRFLYYWPDETVARCRHCLRMSYASQCWPRWSGLVRAIYGPYELEVLASQLHATTGCVGRPPLRKRLRLEARYDRWSSRLGRAAGCVQRV